MIFACIGWRAARSQPLRWIFLVVVAAAESESDKRKNNNNNKSTHDEPQSQETRDHTNRFSSLRISTKTFLLFSTSTSFFYRSCREFPSIFPRKTAATRHGTRARQQNHLIRGSCKGFQRFLHKPIFASIAAQKVEEVLQNFCVLQLGTRALRIVPVRVTYDCGRSATDMALSVISAEIDCDGGDTTSPSGR